MDTKIPGDIIRLGKTDNPEILYEENEAAGKILNIIEELDSEKSIYFTSKIIWRVYLYGNCRAYELEGKHHTDESTQS